MWQRYCGAGASVGAIDQPIQRERHTGFISKRDMPVVGIQLERGSKILGYWSDVFRFLALF
jgi:hypothetical protein